MLFFFLMIRRPPRSTLFPLHDALPIYVLQLLSERGALDRGVLKARAMVLPDIYQDHDKPERMYARAGLDAAGIVAKVFRSEEHTSELQSRQYLVCRLLLEKKKTHSACY